MQPARKAVGKKAHRREAIGKEAGDAVTVFLKERIED
jgi:hypothetical protein